jgi:hypothetical protein
MSPRDYRTMIDRGRKAGLGTADLYRAIAGQPAERSLAPGQTDGNGFVARYDEHGQRIYCPLGNSPRS